MAEEQTEELTRKRPCTRSQCQDSTTKHARFVESDEAESLAVSSATTSSQGPIDVSKASDNKYRYLSSFWSWVDGTTFYPVPNVGNVKVRVTLEAANQLSLSESSCRDCRQKATASGILDAVASVNWIQVNSFDLEQIDDRLYSLATSAKGAQSFGFGNGQAKVLMFELVSLVRQMLCPHHTLLLNLSTPLTHDDHAGLLVKVNVTRKICEVEDSSEGETDRPPTFHPCVMDTEELRGAPDLTVLLTSRPHVFFVVGEVKKKMTRLAKIKIKGWKDRGDKVVIGECERRDSQVGQLLYYLVAVQLRRIQLYLSPSERPNAYEPPSKLLGLFMEQGKTTHVEAVATLVSQGEWEIRLCMGEEVEFSGGGLRSVLRSLHAYLSMDV